MTVSVVDNLSDNSYDPVATQVFSAVVVDDDLQPGDFNRSDTVDGADLIIWEAEYGQGSGADADGDGDSDGFDFLAWQRNFSKTGTAMGSPDIETPSAAGSLGVRGSLVDAALALEWLGNGAEQEETLVVSETALRDAVYDSAPRAANFTPASARTAEPGSTASNSSEVDNADAPWLADELLERIFG